MDIILADSHGTVMGKDQTSANLGLLYLAAYCSPKFPDVKWHYLPQKYSPSDHIQMIRDTRAAIYAVSFTSFTASPTYSLIQKIKKVFPDVLVVCGGPHAGYLPEEVLRVSGADVVVIGEGEQTFGEIIENLQHGVSDFSNIKGLAFINDKGYMVKTEPRPLLPDIDIIPFPRRDLLNNKDFCGLTYSKARPNTEMIITRGCPLRCVFCASPVFRNGQDLLFRVRSPKNIATEVDLLYKLGYREIYFHSDELNVSLDWSIEVCKSLAELGYTDLFFQTNMRSVPMSAELAFWLKKAGFWMVRLGVETTSERVLRGIKKHNSPAKTAQAMQLLSETGIRVFAFLMLYNYWEENGQLKHETTEEVRQTIKDMYAYYRKGWLSYTSWAFACPVQGSELYDIAIRHKMIDNNYYPGDKWESYRYLKDVSRNEFNATYAAARRQQAWMAMGSGNFEWRNWRGIIHKATSMFIGRG